jgi:site-specific DNA-cytosine methylase
VFIIGCLGRECFRQVFPIGQVGGEVNDTQGQYTNTLTARYEKSEATGSYVVESKLNAQEIKQMNKPNHSNDRVYGSDGDTPSLNTMQGGNRQPKVLYSIPVLTPDRIEKRQNGRRMKTENEDMFTLTGQDKHGVSNGSRIRRLTPRECEFLQGFSRDYTKWGGIKYANAKKENAIEILQTLWESVNKGNRERWGLAELITLLKKEILRQKVYETELLWQVGPSGISTGRKLPCQTVGICDKMREVWEREKPRHSSQEQEQVGQLIRELTSIVPKLPYETTQERGWMEHRVCQEPEKRSEGEIYSIGEMSDSQRYKMCGNAVTTNVIREVALKLF